MENRDSGLIATRESSSSHQLNLEAPPMRTRWRHNYDIPMDHPLTTTTVCKSDPTATPSSSDKHQRSIRTTVSAPTPTCSSWANTPSRRAFSSTGSMATDANSVSSNHTLETVPRIERTGLDRNESPPPNQGHILMMLGKAIDRSDIDDPAKTFAKAFISYRHAKGDPVKSLEHTARTMLDNLEMDAPVGPDLAPELFYPEKSCETSHYAHDAARLQAAIQCLPYELRLDRYSQKVTDENAQGIFPPDACLFVGK